MAVVIAAALPSFAQTTNLYRLTDGRHALVTVPADDQPVPAAVVPIMSGFKVSRVETGPTEVFLADEHGTPIDADGDPTNGLTPLLRLPAGTTHAQAIAEVERVE
ncbi:DUF7572 family protein [Gordonia caeni]|uniref:DUF7572 domain-containing protein n=1 Tax=Gordonia caeni TaxID=1007097 RepID=A0ABP7PCT3_9ACTN